MIKYSILPTFIYVFILFFGCGCETVVPQVPLRLAQEQELEEVRIDRKSPEEKQKELIALQKVKRKPYRIAGGDVFNFYVYDNQELEGKGLVVTPDGYISVSLAGPVMIGGLTILEATKKIEDKLKKYIRNPRISLAPIRIQSATFTILGKVNSPNRYVLQNNARLTDAIALAGGLAMGQFDGDSVEMANLRDAYVVRQGKILPVDFSKALYKGDQLNNIPLVNGDYIYIPSNLNASIYILGAVNNPTSIGYKDGMTVLKALTFARGVTI